MELNGVNNVRSFQTQEDPPKITVTNSSFLTSIWEIFCRIVTCLFCCKLMGDNASSFAPNRVGYSSQGSNGAGFSENSLDDQLNAIKMRSDQANRQAAIDDRRIREANASLYKQVDDLPKKAAERLDEMKTEMNKSFDFVHDWAIFYREYNKFVNEIDPLIQGISTGTNTSAELEDKTTAFSQKFDVIVEAFKRFEEAGCGNPKMNESTRSRLEKAREAIDKARKALSTGTENR